MIEITPSTGFPTATYRLQLTPDFGFSAVADRFAHLTRLRVSHLYLSPIAQSIPESSHGYDVVDHTAVRAEFGGAADFEAMLDAAHTAGLRVIVDHVPNHMSIARPDLNAWWWETLRDGPGAPAAAWFDIDWDHNDGRVIVPVLDDALTVIDRARALAVVDDELVVHGSRRLPLRPGTEHLTLDELLTAQHYELTSWRDPRRNMRRFFTVDDLAGLRVEQQSVADIVNTLPRRYCKHPAFAGVRLDHIDGLADPTGYLDLLAEQLGADAHIWVEKILAPSESLPKLWPVAGTTGYDFIAHLDPVLIDRSAESAFTAAWIAWSDDRRGFAEIEEVGRVEVLDSGLAPDFERLARAAQHELAMIDPDEVSRDVHTLSTTLPRYRTYLPDVGADVVMAMSPSMVRDAIASGAATGTRTRWQQLTGPVMAKGTEDRAFYQYLRFVALNEVGGNPGEFGHDVDTLHAANEQRSRDWPATMNAGSTHDTKRSEDVRDRLLTMTWIADEVFEEADRLVPALAERLHLDPTVVWLGWQTEVATPGLDAERFVAYLVKATREAERFTSWSAPDPLFEARLADLAAHLLTSSSTTSAALDALAPLLTVEATVLRLMSPGVPDIYQGTETWSYQLVDPDNRRVPDWTAITDELGVAVESELTIADLWAEADPAVKPSLVRALLDLRRRLPDAFGGTGTYAPLSAGEGAVAFVRGGDVGEVVVVARRGLASVEGSIELPTGRWFDLLDPSSPSLHGEVATASLVGSGHDLTLPVAVLERD